MTPNSSRSTVPANIAAIPAATADTAGARIWQPSTNALAGYVAATNSCPYVYAPGTDQPYGPEAEFARQWCAANPAKQLVIVKLNIGSTPLQKAASFQNGTGGTANANIIECWDPTLANDPNDATQASRNINAALLVQSYLTATIAALQAEGKTTINTLGMLWLQGQNDAYFSATAPSYGTALAAFRTWVRANLLAGGAQPFVMSLVEDNANWPYRAEVRYAQQQEASNDAASYLAPTDDLTIGADTFHYAPPSVVTLGDRSYASMVGPRVQPKAPLPLAMTGAAYSASATGQALTGGYGQGGRLPKTNFSVGGILFIGAAPSGVKVAFGQANWCFVGVNAAGVPIAFIGNNSAVTLTGTASIVGNSAYVEVDVSEAGSTLYVNGVAVASSTTAFSATGPTNTNAERFEVRTFMVSRGTYDWTGAVDEVAVFSGQRGGVAPNPTFTGAEAGLLSLYHLDGSGAD